MPGRSVAMSTSSSSRSVAAIGAMVMAEGRVSAPQGTFVGQRFHDRRKSARMSSAPDTRAMSLHALRWNVCPQKHEQESRYYIAHRPCDVRRPRPGQPFLVGLQGHVAHDVPLLL